VSIVGIVLLVAAAALVLAAEWARISSRAPKRPRKKPHLRVVQDDESDEFARAVERDLANLPTYDPNERRR
jgi:hypothetical protein